MAPSTQPDNQESANSGGRPTGRRFFEDQPPEMQAMQRARRRAEIEAIRHMRFPVQADFGGQAVGVLGPVARFSPYKEQTQGPEDPFQLMVQPEKGDRFITFANLLKVDGKPLVSPMLPWRVRPNQFALPPPAKVSGIATMQAGKRARMRILP